MTDWLDRVATAWAKIDSVSRSEIRGKRWAWVELNEGQVTAASAEPNTVSYEPRCDASLTPAEARRLAALLTAAADAIEKSGSVW